MKFEFKKYNKITNTYDSKHVKGVKMAMVDQKIPDIWSITEKIHGSNFACYSDGETCQFASRNNMLNDDQSDAFYNFRSIKQDTIKSINKLCNDVKRSDSTVNYIIVYGELFGGMYEHEDVAKVNQSRVQKGVQYCPDLHFKLVDIYLNRNDDSEYLHIESLYLVCLKLQIDFIYPIFNGTLDECLEYQNDFDSLIYKDYNLPDVGENICEGIVIKPTTSFYDRRGNRAIFKSKNAKFAEKAGEKKRPPKEIKELSMEDQNEVNMSLSYVTMARLENIESKIGKLEEAKQIGQFIKEFMYDVIEDIKYETEIAIGKPARIAVSRQAKELIMQKLYES